MHLNAKARRGSRLIATAGENVFVDRLGSVVRRGTTGLSYYPYGEEKGGTTTQERDKYGTYFRDAVTNLDYARQRYYSSTVGRFMSPGVTGLDYAQQRYYSSMTGRFVAVDPYDGKAASVNNPAQPASWNRYSYVLDDSVNGTDPSGLGEGVTACDLYPNSPGCSALPYCRVNPTHPACAHQLTKPPKKPTNEERVLEGAVMRSSDHIANLNCAGLFLDPDSNTPENRQALSAKLQQVWDSGTMRVLPERALPVGTGSDVPAFTTSTFGLMYFVSGRSFFTGTYNGQPLSAAPFNGLSLTSLQELMVIHEFMHSMGIVGPDSSGTEQYRLPNGTAVTGSLGISQEVRDNCFR